MIALLKLLIYIAFLLLLFFVLLWNVCTFFRPVKSLIKFFKSLKLFFNDLWDENLKTFRGYGFWLFTGLGGAGKTISMVDYAMRMKAKYPLLRVYTTFDCSFADGHINKWEDIMQLENFTLIPITEDVYKTLKPFYAFSSVDKKTGEVLYFKKVHQGIIFLFDEIHFTFNSRNWKSCPNGAIEQISQNRKFKKLILGSSQSYNRVDIILREQCNFVADCKNVFWGRFVKYKLYDRKAYETLNERLLDNKGHRLRIKPKQKYCFIGSDFVRSAYDTNEIQKDIYKVSSSSEMIAEGVLQAVIDFRNSDTSKDSKADTVTLSPTGRKGIVQLRS